MLKKNANIVQHIGIALTLAILSIPLLKICTPLKLFVHYKIGENIQDVAKPSHLVNSFYSREWQHFEEQRFIQKLAGLRAFFILSYNELMRQLFRMNPQKNYIRTPQFGYYPVDSIMRLNDDVVHYDMIRQHYQHAAVRLRVLQNLLHHYGVTLIVVPAPTKVRIYPEYVASYLIAPPSTIMQDAVSYGDILEEEGVNVLNIQHIFSEKKTTSPWPFFTDTSFHWSLWGGCMATNEILRKAETLIGKPFYSINCSNVSYEKSKWEDRDIAEILNIFSKEAIIGKAPFPIITPELTPHSGRDYKIAIIGDSFSGQIMYALAHAFPKNNWRPNWLTFYSYFTTRQTLMLNGQKTDAPLNKDLVLPEILSKELLISEVSDGAVVRDPSGINSMEFSSTWFLLDKLLPEIKDGTINLKNLLTNGWNAIDNGAWSTNNNTASFAMRNATNGEPVHILLDVENKLMGQNKPRHLTLLINGQPIKKISIKPGRQILRLEIPSKTQSPMSDAFLSEITLSSKTQPLEIILHGARITGAELSTSNEISKISSHQETASNQPANMGDLFSAESYGQFDEDGLSTVESNGKDSCRWGFGPKTQIRFYVDENLPDSKRQFLLKFGFKNLMKFDQTVTVRLNGKDIHIFSSKEINQQQEIDSNLTLDTQKGVNMLEFIYHEWCHTKKESKVWCPRPLAVAVTHLSIQKL